jgi:hypothetical protein
MFTKPSALPWLVNLRPTMLDDHAWVRPFVDFFRAEGFAWAHTGATHSFAGRVDDALVQRAVTEYATEGARP